MGAALQVSHLSETLAVGVGEAGVAVGVEEAGGAVGEAGGKILPVFTPPYSWS